VFNFRSVNPIKSFREYFKLKRWLKEINPQVIHIHQINRLAYWTARAAHQLHIPILSTSWGSDVLLMPQKNFIFKYIIRKTLERSSIITANSYEMLRAMRAIHNNEQKYIWQQYGIENVPELSEKSNVIFSNRLHEPLYRIDQILIYFSEFIKDHPHWNLVVAGTGTQTEYLNSLANELNISSQTNFIGWLDSQENAYWYAKSKIYISIPESDGTAISVLESLANGCLPILPDLPVTAEWVEDGKTAVIEKSNQNPLYQAIDLLQTPFAEINREKIKKFAIRKECGRAYFELYQKLTKE
ncbi:MAG: glycosyltransferase, partial [Bacteroidota bacterium]